MATLATALADLQAAVTDVAARVSAGTGPLQDALAKAQADLAALQSVDDADKAALAASLADAQSAADAIETDVTALNAVAAPPV